MVQRSVYVKVLQGGRSARLFTLLASLPLSPLPDGGEQPLQPIHVDDLIQALLNLIETDRYCGRRVPLVGPHAVYPKLFACPNAAGRDARSGRTAGAAFLMSPWSGAAAA